MNDMPMKLIQVSPKRKRKLSDRIIDDETIEDDIIKKKKFEIDDKLLYMSSFKR
jgi:hypothetical protein